MCFVFLFGVLGCLGVLKRHSRGRCPTAVFLLSFLRCHADPDGQNDLTDALPVEVDLRSWLIIRTATRQKSLTAMVNQTSPPPMVYELL